MGKRTLIAAFGVAGGAALAAALFYPSLIGHPIEHIRAKACYRSPTPSCLVDAAMLQVSGDNALGDITAQAVVSPGVV